MEEKELESPMKILNIGGKSYAHDYDLIIDFQKLKDATTGFTGGVGKTRIHAISALEIFKNRYGSETDLTNFTLKVDNTEFDFSQIVEFAKSGVRADSDFVRSITKAKSITIVNKLNGTASEELIRFEK